MAQPDPLVISTLNQYRAALDSREDALMMDMARHWLMVESRLDADIAALAYEMAERAKDGRVITQQMVWRMERYQKIKAQLEEQVAIYNRDYAAATITRAQEDAGTLGISAANDAISASYTQVGAMGPMWNRLNLNAIESMIGFTQDGTPLYKLLKADYPDALDGLTNALVNGMARGLGPAQVAANMRAGVNMGFDRSLLIARTEMARAYRTGSTKQYRESGVVSRFYRLVKKATACAACLMLDGQPLDLAEELSDHPAGKCQAVPGVQGVGKPKWETGPQWFRAQDPERQREILGPGRYQLWKDGQIELKDVAKIQHDETWGDQPRVATVKELTGGTE